MELIRQELANLPKTLDETYERIFLGIPKEGHHFVHYTLKWIYYYNELHKMSIPCDILLMAVERSISKSNHSIVNSFYDTELLREFCGCLITIQPGGGFWETSPAISFAHYTVWEYLDSDRIQNSSVASFSVIKNETNLELTEISLLEILSLPSSALLVDPIDSTNLWDTLDKDFCWISVRSSINAIHLWGHEISQQHELTVLVFSLFNHMKSHFPVLSKMAPLIDGEAEWSDGLHYACPFWSFTSINLAHHNSAILYGLMQTDKKFHLANSFLQWIAQENLLQSVLSQPFYVRDYPWWVCSTENVYPFHGTIVEIFAQCRDERSVEFLMDVDVESFNPTATLMSYISSAYISGHKVPFNFIRRKLELGANSNAPQYRITSLQIAIAQNWLEVVELLLEAGADPNNAGNSAGIKWEKGSFLGRLNLLHGSSPLYICRHYQGQISDLIVAANRQEDESTIEKILLQYGAKEFQEPCNEWGDGSD
jgi:hypothetical protein